MASSGMRDLWKCHLQLTGMHLLHSSMYIGRNDRWSILHSSLLSTLLSLFSYFSCVSSRDAPHFGSVKLKQQQKKMNYFNALFLQLIVLTLQCCCVPCASRQANQWLLAVTPSPKRLSFVYLYCVMSF